MPPIVTLLKSAYGIDCTDIEQLRLGMGTRNWKAVTSASEYFVKEYHRPIDHAHVIAALEVSEFARQRGTPAPKILRTTYGALLACDRHATIAVSEFISHATSGGPLTCAQMQQAGRALGNLHRRLRDFDTTLPSETEEWMTFDPSRKIAEIEHYLRIIDELPRPGDFDRSARMLLLEQHDMIGRIPSLLSGLPALTTQVIHGDYSTHNVLFRGDHLAAIVDFEIPKPFLIAYELGRIALNAENLAADQWREKARTLVSEYCAVVQEADVQLAPRIWLIQLMRSTYGIKQHYAGPIELQGELDQYWVMRRNAAKLLLLEMDTLEKEFAGIVRNTIK